MTVDEELSKIEDGIRRLKIEYEAYFSGGNPRPPNDLVFRVETSVKRLTDGTRMSFAQRYRFNQLVQKYAVNNDLWRRKLKEKEEGRGRFPARRREAEAPTAGGPVQVVCADPDKEQEKVDQLLKAVVEARRQVGARVDDLDPLSFKKFLGEKTREVKQSLGCDKVQFSVSVEEGKVKFKAVKSD
jgi:hypothetical protein